MIDLSLFCDMDYGPASSRGLWTYATNGHIAIRVPRRPGVEIETKAAVDSLPWNSAASYEPAIMNLPAESFSTISCDECYGGNQCDCPNCSCACEECGGTGNITESDDADLSIEICGIILAGKYARLISKLPNLQVGATIFNSAAGNKIPILAFRFDGGEGLLMGLSAPNPTHIAA